VRPFRGRSMLHPNSLTNQRHPTFCSLAGKGTPQPVPPSASPVTPTTPPIIHRGRFPVTPSGPQSTLQRSPTATDVCAGAQTPSMSLSTLVEERRLSAEMLPAEFPVSWPAFSAYRYPGSGVSRARRNPGSGRQRAIGARQEPAPAQACRLTCPAPHQVAVTAATLGAARRLWWPAPSAQETPNGGQSGGERTLRSGRQVKRVAPHLRFTADAGQLHHPPAPGQCALRQRCSTPGRTTHG